MSAETSNTADAGTAATRGLLTNRLFWAGYGTALAVMGTRLPLWTWPPDTVQPLELAFTIVLFAALAQPYTGRPVLTSVRIHHLAVAHRNTLLPGAFVILVATEKPPAWAAGVDALLLAGYLLLIDALTVPAGVLRRIASPASLLALAALIAGATALVALPASAGAYRPILAAAAAAAALGAALATAFGSAEERRVGSRGTERRKQDRPSE
jgi:hypothetical protein